jgi:arginyl-tRNA synthetase
MKTKISRLISKSLIFKDRDLIELFVPTNSKHGDYSSNIAMKLAGKQKKKPMDIAKKLCQSIKLPDYLEKIEVAKPGYLNFFLKDKIYLDNLEKILDSKTQYGCGDLHKGKKVMIEFAHPNPFKVMHIGHLRNITLGESLVRLFEAQGAKVIRTNYQGDVGLHVAKCLYAMNKTSEKSFPNDTDSRANFLGQCYVEGAKAYEEDSRAKAEIIEINRKIYEQTDSRINHLWQLGVKWSLDKFKQIYNRLDSVFDREYLESETLALGLKYTKQALKKGILSKSQGAVIFAGKKYGLDTRVFLNSQGFLTYEGKELGLVYLKLKEYGKLDLHINNVAVEQKSFFKVLYKVEELLDPKNFKEVNYHNAYEFVGLKSGKMSSRKGKVVGAEYILEEAKKRIEKIVKKGKNKLTEKEIDEIAVSAVKYAYLRMSPFKYLAFDLDSCVSFSGDSGPYLQYTYVRTTSILKKSNYQRKKALPTSLNQEEKLLLQKLYQYPEVLENSTRVFSPNYLTAFLNELGQLFNNFYVKHRVGGNQFRLNLTKAVGQVIRNGLTLLGIKTLERM